MIKTYEKYVWPETEITSRLPKPASSYGRIVLSTSDTFKIVVEKTKEPEPPKPEEKPNSE